MDGSARIERRMRALAMAKECADLGARGIRNAKDYTWEKVLESLWTVEDRDPATSQLPSFLSPSPRVAPGVIALELA